MWIKFFFCTKVVLARLSYIFFIAWMYVHFFISCIQNLLVCMDINLLLLSLFSLCLLLYHSLRHFCDKKRNYFWLIKWFIGLNIHCMHELYTFTLLLLIWFHKIGKLSCSPHTRVGSITWDMIYEDHVLSLMEACGLNMWPISMSPLFFMQSRRWRRSIQWRNIN